MANGSEMRQIIEALASLFNNEAGWPEGRVPDADCRELTFQLRDQYLSVVLSDVSENCLRRLTTYLVQEMTRIELFLLKIEVRESRLSMPVGRCRLYLRDIIVEIRESWANYFDDSLVVSPGYLSFWKRKFTPLARRVSRLLKSRGLCPELKEILSGYIQEFQLAMSGTVDYHAIEYAMVLIERIHVVLENDALSDEPEAALVKELTYLNFNHLGFLALRINRLAKEGQRTGNYSRSYYEEMLQRLYPDTMDQGIAYDPSLPTIGQLLYNWTNEQVMAHRTLQMASPPAKVFLNFSVPQLACMLRAFHEAGLFGNIALTELFSFASMHLRTRRQDNVSPGSLGKEYYIISQQTAARVMGFFEKITADLRRVYFPVWVAICIRYFYYLENC